MTTSLFSADEWVAGWLANGEWSTRWRPFRGWKYQCAIDVHRRPGCTRRGRLARGSDGERKPDSGGPLSPSR